MNTISNIISTLSEEEKGNFISLLRKKNRRNDTKNIQLFKLLDTNQIPKNLDIQLYGKPSKNTYYALYKRLYDNLLDFIALNSFKNETSEELEIFKMLLASRIFFEHKKYVLGFKTINKAEKKALEHDCYSILSELYQTKMQYAHIPASEPFPTLVSKFKTNQQLAQQEENLTLVHAIIKQQLIKGAMTNAKQDIAILITTTLQDHAIEISDSMTFKSLYQLMEMVTTIANAHRDYHTVLPFMTAAYNSVLKKPRTPHKHLFYHINILYLMSNALFRYKDFDRAHSYLHMMEKHLQEQDGKYHIAQSGKLVLLKALIANYSGKSKNAIEYLEQYQMTKAYKNTDLKFELHLCLLVCYFQQNCFKDAHSVLRLFTNSDQWYTEHIGHDWVLKKHLIEILLHIELGNNNLVDSRIKSFERKHYPYLKKVKEHRVITFLQLVRIYYHYPEQITSIEFRDKVENSFDWITSKQEDIYVMSFYAWLKSKMYKTNLYQTTLALIHSTT